MRIVFLDVDGVLNTASLDGNLEDELLDNLADLLRAGDPDVGHEKDLSDIDTWEDNVGVVFSSTWRFTQAWKSVQRAMEERSVEVRWLGATPDLSGTLYPPSNSHENRTHEVLGWLFLNTVEASEAGNFPFDMEKALSGQVDRERFHLPERVSVSHFVCLDDMILATKSCFADAAGIAERQVVTRVATGFTRENLANARSILFTTPNYSVEYAKAVFQSCTNPDCLHTSLSFSSEDGSAAVQRGGESREKTCCCVV
jgi:hypothetical protein